jgi:hypothetical protein
MNTANATPANRSTLAFGYVYINTRSHSAPYLSAGVGRVAALEQGEWGMVELKDGRVRDCRGGGWMVDEGPSVDGADGWRVGAQRSISIARGPSRRTNETTLT